MYSETFGRLLKAAVKSIAACERKKESGIESDLGEEIGVAATTIQHYKEGNVPLESRAVRVLAEAAVKRGHLNRHWLRQFLHAPNYPNRDRLIAELDTDTQVQARPNCIYHNLRAPNYNQFVMREDAWNRLIDGLNQRSNLATPILDRMITLPVYS